MSVGLRLFVIFTADRFIALQGVLHDLQWFFLERPLLDNNSTELCCGNTWKLGQAVWQWWSYRMWWVVRCTATVQSAWISQQLDSAGELQPTLCDALPSALDEEPLMQIWRDQPEEKQGNGKEDLCWCIWRLLAYLQAWSGEIIFTTTPLYKSISSGFLLTQGRWETLCSAFFVCLFFVVLFCSDTGCSV